MDILHRSTEPPLLTRLKQMLDASERADIAVGYFFVSGFEAVSDQIASVDGVRLLVGRTDRETLEEVALGLQQVEAVQQHSDLGSTIRRSEKPALARKPVEAVGEGVGRLHQTHGTEEAVRRLRDLIVSGQTKIRAYLRERLHAKAYVCWYRPGPEPGAAVVGSSNLTLAGLEGNTELNVRVTGDANMQVLKEWFDTLWDDSEDISTDIVAELNRSWPIAATPPYHVYLKALYELYRDETGLPSLEAPAREAPALTPFQLDAVRRALAVLDRHGGVVVGDVVGLGKTYIGAELLRQLRFTDGDPLIICPAGLRSMWEKMSEQFGIAAQVVSMSAIVPPATPEDGEDEEGEEYVTTTGINLLEDYPHRGPVLIDESHNFRNPRSRRHRAIAAYLASGGHKTILVTATPQNLGPLDIYYQLRLFLDDLDHGLHLEPLNLEDFFRAVQKWYAYRMDHENWEQEFKAWQRERAEKAAPATARSPGAPPPKPQPPTIPQARIEDVLVPVFIRRRRKDIVELYGRDIEINGEKLHFPQPTLENVPYNLSRVYRKAGTLADLADLLKRHRGARYSAAEYLTDASKELPQYQDLKRARNRVADLVRALLWKRLESSVPAFKSTIETLIRSNANFQESLRADFAPIGRTATRLLAGESFDADELLEALRQEEARRATGPRSKLVHPAPDFDTARWLRDLQEDLDLLDDLHQRVERVAPSDDDKLKALKAFMAQPEVRNAKLLVFSESQDTVDYVYSQVNPDERDSAIAKVSGETSDTKFDAVLKRFAPAANLKQGEKMPGPEVRLVIATDRLSEGQNLQDCNRVLNYDLHWNPVRLIQRFGRVDRIGTKHEMIHLHSMWPDTDLDAELNLTDRLHHRIQAFHDLIGLDSKLLSQRERVNPRAMYRIYVKKRLPDEDDIIDEVAAAQRGISILQQLQNDDPDLWKVITDLPDGIRSARPARAHARDDLEEEDFVTDAEEPMNLQLSLEEAREESAESPFTPPVAGDTVVFLKQGDIAAPYAVTTDLAPRSITTAQMLSAIECGPEEEAHPLPQDANERVMAAFAEFGKDVSQRLGRARRPRDTRLRRYLTQQFRRLRETHKDDDDELKRIGVLQDIFLRPLPGYILGEADEARHMRLEGTALLRRLEALRSRHRLTPPDEEEQEPEAPEAVRIVCSEGLV